MNKHISSAMESRVQNLRHAGAGIWTHTHMTARITAQQVEIADGSPAFCVTEDGPPLFRRGWTYCTNKTQAQPAKKPSPHSIRWIASFLSSSSFKPYIFISCSSKTHSLVCAFGRVLPVRRALINPCILSIYAMYTTNQSKRVHPCS